MLYSITDMNKLGNYNKYAVFKNVIQWANNYDC